MYVFCKMRFEEDVRGPSASLPLATAELITLLSLVCDDVYLTNCTL